MGICLAGASIATAAPRRVPDVIPGIPNRYPVARVFTGPPLVVWLAELSGRRRLLAAAVVDRGPWAVLDKDRNALLRDSASADLGVTVTELPRTAGLFLVAVGRTSAAPADLDHYYLVHHDEKTTELVCRFASPPRSGPLQLQVVATSRSRFEITSSAGGERISYVQDAEGLCRPSFATGAPSDFSYENAFAHAELLFGRERWGEAADAHELVLHMRPLGSHGEEAALAAIQALDSFLDLQCSPSPGDLEPLPIDGLLAKRVGS